MEDQSAEKDQLLFSEQVVRILLSDIRASLHRELTPEQVSLALQETSDRLKKRLDADNSARRQEPPQKPLPESVRDQISVLIVDILMWSVQDQD